MILIVSTYDEPNPERAREYEECLRANQEHPSFRAVVEVRMSPAQRMPFDIAFELSRKLATPGEVVGIANSDVTFDPTIDLAEELLDDRTFLAISRWEPSEDNGSHHEMRVTPALSQDAWFFRSPARAIVAPFSVGLPGCDSRLVCEARRAGYRVVNPWRSIHVLHHHASNVRHYTEADRLKGPYGYTDP